MRRADDQALDRGCSRASRFVVGRADDDQPAAGAALLAGVAERRRDDARDRLVEVGVVVDDDRVLAAHLGDDALDVRWPGRTFAAASMMPRPTSLLPVKAIVSTPGCSTSACPTSRPGPGRYCTTSFGTPASRRISTSRAAMSGDCAAGLRMAQLPAASAPRRHPADDREREVPRRDDRRDARGLRGSTRCSSPRTSPIARGVCQPLGLRRVVAQVVARLDDVAVRLVPRLGALEDHQRRRARSAVPRQCLPRGAGCRLARGAGGRARPGKRRARRPRPRRRRRGSPARRGRARRRGRPG